MKQPIVRLGLTFCFFVFLVTVGAAARPAFAQCEKVTDAKIVADIYNSIKDSKALASQISHINVVSTNMVVKLQGWADDKSSYNDIVAIPMNMACVRMVNVQIFADAPPAGKSTGCASGTKPCGDTCIPAEDVCNITGALGLISPTFHFERNYALVMSAPEFACE